VLTASIVSLLIAVMLETVSTPETCVTLYMATYTAQYLMKQFGTVTPDLQAVPRRLCAADCACTMRTSLSHLRKQRTENILRICLYFTARDVTGLDAVRCHYGNGKSLFSGRFSGEKFDT
jgi:hypothetical protein